MCIFSCEKLMETKMGTGITNRMMIDTLAKLFKDEHGILPDKIFIGQEDRYEELTANGGSLTVKVGKAGTGTGGKLIYIYPDEIHKQSWVATSAKIDGMPDQRPWQIRQTKATVAALRQITKQELDRQWKERHKWVDVGIDFLLSTLTGQGDIKTHTVYIPQAYDFGRGVFTYSNSFHNATVFPTTPTDEWRATGKSMDSGYDMEISLTLRTDDMPICLVQALERFSND